MTDLLSNINHRASLLGTKLPGIYKITSLQNPNKVYIGSTQNINQRWGRHLKDMKRNIHPNKKLQNHYNKYGEGDLFFSILFICEQDELLEAEQFFLDSYVPWFNNNKLAINSTGTKRSAETKKKISESQIGRIPWNKGLTKEDDIRVFINTQRSAATMKERGIYSNRPPLSNETIQKIREKNIGRKLSDASRKKISQSLMGHQPWNKGLSGYKIKPLTQERKDKIGRANKGKIRSAETIESLKQGWVKRKLKQKNK